MDLKFEGGAIASAPKKCVRVRLIKGTSHALVIEDGTTTLEYPSDPIEKMTRRAFRTLIRGIVQTAKSHKLEHIAIPLYNEQFSKLARFGERWFYQTIAENVLLAAYEFNAYKSKSAAKTLALVGIYGHATKEAKEGFARGVVIAQYANECRDIANTAGGDMTPSLLGNAAKRIAKGTSVSVRVLGKKEIDTLGMGALSAVGKGAADEPKFIIMEYWGAGKPKASKKKTTRAERLKDPKAPIVFVGKGITFDTGGLQIKPGMAMYEMHMDMSGGASVIAAVSAAAKLKLKKNIIGLIPSAENAASRDAMRPGDVICTMAGKTVEVLHTDAEGRLVLADALTYSRRYNPKLVIDVATLTGAALVALGRHASALITKSRSLEDTIRTYGDATGEYVAPLPLTPEYIQYTKGTHADIANIPGESRDGGCINGAAFLSHFTKGLHWAHIDMAPRMTAAASDKLAKGATGEPTRLLVHIAENF